MKTKRTINRRDFIRLGGGGLAGAFTIPFLYSGGSMISRSAITGSIKLYMINVTKERNFSHGTWSNRQHVILQVSSGDHHGWSEALASKNDPGFDLEGWSRFLKPLAGKSLGDAVKLARDSFFSGEWKRDQSELVQLALYDLDGKISGVPVINSWDLDKNEPVPGVFTILEDKTAMALKEAAIAGQQGLTSHVKMKMFGKESLDMELLVALRKFFGPQTYLMADANRGYRDIPSFGELVRILRSLSSNGLDAMEDPSELNPDQWIELQKQVGTLALIPDYIMRPAAGGLKIFDPAMGKYFNLHPDQMGSMVETAELARKIVNSGSGLMIGDSSFIGPSCTIWQQIAIGAGASWVEAIEKPQESDAFLQCITRSATRRSDTGLVSLPERLPGFGLEVDEHKLRRLSDRFYKVNSSGFSN